MQYLSRQQGCEFLKEVVFYNGQEPGFEDRLKGGHHIFTRVGIGEILNLQPKGSKAKAYQVKQIRAILVSYSLGETDVD